MAVDIAAATASAARYPTAARIQRTAATRAGFARLVVSTAVVESEALAVLRHSDPTVVHRHVLLHV